MSDTIEELFYPRILNSLRGNLPPVQCIVWKGRDEYEKITFENVYPFDTIHDIKRMICAYYNQKEFHPNFLFVGVPQEGVPQEDSSSFLAIDYLWYENGENKAKNTHRLRNPIQNLNNPDDFFFLPNGEWSSPSRSDRGRSTIENVFLKWQEGELPTFHVFPLVYLVKLYKEETRQINISPEEWNKKFGPYFIHLTPDYTLPTREDIEFVEIIKRYIRDRSRSVDALQTLLEKGIESELSKPTTNGIRQLRLIWDVLSSHRERKTTLHSFITHGRYTYYKIACKGYITYSNVV